MSNPGGGASGNTIDPVVYGADKTGATDATAAFRLAYAQYLATGKPISPSPGVYTVSGAITGSGPVTTPIALTATPGTVTIQRGIAGSPGTIVNSRIIDIEGSVNASSPLSADAPAGSTSLTFAALPAGIGVGSTLEVTSNVIFSGNAITAEYIEVASITGTGPFTVNLNGALEEAYLVANAGAAAVVNWAGTGTYIRGITFRQTAQNRDSPVYPLVTLNRVQGFQFDFTTCRDADVPGLDLRNVSRGWVNDYYCENLTDNIPTYVGYGLNVNNNCRAITVTRPKGTQVRHVFTTNADAGFGCPRHIKVTDGIAYETHSGGWNTHREGKWVTFTNCESFNDIGGFFIRAPYTTIVNPLVIGPGVNPASPGTGISISSDNGTFTATNSKVIGGTVILGPNSLHGWFTDCPGPHQIIGLKVVGPGTSGTNFFGQTNASQIELIDCQSFSPKGSQHFICGVGTGHKVHGGTFTGGALPIASVAAPTGGIPALVISGSIAFDTTFNLEQNQRALIQLGNQFSAQTSSQTMRDFWDVVTVDCTGGARVMTMPATPVRGRKHVLIKLDSSANALSVAVTGGTLFGTSSTTTQGGVIRITCDGTNTYCG